MVFLVVGPAIDIKLFAMQVGMFGRAFAVRPHRQDQPGHAAPAAQVHDLLRRLAGIHTRHGRFTEAREVLERALPEHPSDDGCPLQDGLPLRWEMVDAGRDQRLQQVRRRRRARERSEQGDRLVDVLEVPPGPVLVELLKRQGIGETPAVFEGIFEYPGFLLNWSSREISAGGRGFSASMVAISSSVSCGSRRMKWTSCQLDSSPSAVPVQGTDQFHEFHAHPEFAYLAGGRVPGSVLSRGVAPLLLGLVVLLLPALPLAPLPRSSTWRRTPVSTCA